ncbi:uncharacterized protein LOC115626370 [Scaptodrosophila lebanonensis]|uniref:Uncharacterized protein LOC115626370 n=1 Tax=Drosophila lebanonensis TaxID=7225 RepID=A0A6J2TPZ9_DROLE|nr:uncharacterized protein LOC115626370 [Scaptodrosophila lebanonensis]
MEVATTNNHSQSHHHHHHHNHHLQAHHHGSGPGGGGVVSGSGSGSRSPFQREVREWQRIDPDTGALFSGRLEADRWINGPLNSYGKISDSQNISQPNGTQHTQRKQFEVLQSRTANGAMQVIRTQTVQKTSSTSRWSSSTSTTTTSGLSSSNNKSLSSHSHWAPIPALSQSVDICEVSDDEADDGQNSSSDSDVVVVDNSANEVTAIELRNGHSQAELVDDHVDFVVINGHDPDDDDDADADPDHHYNAGHLHKPGHNLLLDTAPSLKLSNLMKSSSSISSQSSNNSNLTTAATTSLSNTHRNASKISLHAIVGHATAKAQAQPATTTPTTPTTAAAVAAAASSATSSTPPWHKRLSEQPDLYGNSNSSKLKVLRVGGSGGGGGGGGVGAGADVASPTQRRDLESFRHYNDDGNENAAAAAAAAADDEDLRLSARHQRRQQVSRSVYAPPVPAPVPLQRSRSISTDDLSNDWEQRNSDEEPGEWRRVSKLRRSFQSHDYHQKTTPPVARRPLDLPTNSVSVARMRAELENGRRLNTAMRNNHVDLAALDTILNTPTTATTTTTPLLKPTVAKRSTFLTAESLQEIRGKLKKLSDESLYKEDFLAYQARSVEPAPPLPEEHKQPPVTSAFRPVHNTHSLESRQRQKDTSSSEWHLRRKSYGFEKMSPPEDKSIFRVDASTDSGLGRSGEQLGNWSPTERNAGGVTNGGTIIHFGARRQPIRGASPTNEGELTKRHSIAVEETWRDMRKTSQVHVNGNVETSTSTITSHLQQQQQQQRGSAQKRVEFCKTEVHFAAESGRVNIVETDGKPPPTQNFRRRRRTASGPLQSLVKSASTVRDNVTHFGDDTQRRKTISSSTVAYRATLMDPPEVVSQEIANSSGTQVTVTTMPKPLETRYSLLESTSCNSYTSTSGVDTTDNETDELCNIRGILKNKPVKPKPYHLGENIESAEVLWSVPPTLKSERESPLGRECVSPDDSSISTKSVAERVRIVEQRQFDTSSSNSQQISSPAGNGYSTKINLSLGNDDWTETGRFYPNYIRTGHRRASAQELLLQDLRQHQRILDEGLKSTSLIMKTMRSASEFDEAMRRLSIASIESALMQPTIVIPTPMLRSHSYQEGSQTSRRSSTTSITSSDLFGSALYDSLPRNIPLAPPRLKLLGNTQIPVSQQLTQLRRMYDAAEEQEDSADEEVKRYFRDNNNSDSGGGTQDSSSLEDVRIGSEYSSSWSRLKAKRTIWKIEAQEQTFRRADLPKSNVMNIALHAPKLEKPKPTPPTLRIGQLVPVAKPRTLFVQPQPQPTGSDNADESGNESLKIVKEARGARKLREHELSYFGVQQQQQQSQSNSPSTKINTTSTATTNPRRTLPSRSKLTHNEDAVQPATTTLTTTTKWQLLNDRPDLLRHSPHGIETQQQQQQKQQQQQPPPTVPEFDEHCYENIANELTTTFRIKSPSPSYERKADLQRDAQILSEMTRNADQTLKALSDEAALKDQRRRSSSLQRRSAKPLETIDEKVYNAERQALSVARGTFASEARRNSRHSTPSPTRARSSSQSSIECCPRARSRSLSSEREYGPSKTRTRSSSRESVTHGAGGSSDEQVTKTHTEQRLRTRTPKRERSRHEEAERPRHNSSSSSKQRSSSNADPKRTHQHHSSGSRSRHRELENGSSSKHSSGTRLVRSSRVSEESRARASGQRAAERSRAGEKHREELTRSHGHSSRSRHSEQQQQHSTRESKPGKPSHHSSSSTRNHETTNTTTAAHKKSTTKSTSTTKASTHKAHSISNNNNSSNELTYVYVTNLANTQTSQLETEPATPTIEDDERHYASIDELVATPTPPAPPPRRKRKPSLIPVAIKQQQQQQHKQPTYEHRTKLEMIPPSYSNQSTLRCRSLAKRKPPLKGTQSTSSSFAFLPYLPAKRNSNVSHVYDNYLLYATPSTTAAESKLRPYQHNLINEHAQLFGGGRGDGAFGQPGGGRLGFGKRLRMRQVRSSVSTHQPFGICTCS